jgi:hypothetical protein
MTVTDCDIAVNTDDWYVSSVAGRIDGTTTLRSERNNILFPNNSATAYGDVDTSVIPTTDVISSAVLHFYVHSITKPKRGNVTSYIYMLSANETTWSLINSQLNPTVGWNTVTLTAGEIAQIDTGASQKTRFRWSTDDPGVLKQMQSL